MRSDQTRRTTFGLGVGVLLASALAACTGENLFTGVAVSGAMTAPEVTITSPGADQNVAAGTNLSVTASVTSSQGVSQLVFSGIFEDGSAAFTSQTVPLPNPQDTTVTKSLVQAGTATGSAQLIVEATDIFGAVGSDTVGITIGP